MDYTAVFVAASEQDNPELLLLQALEKAGHKATGQPRRLGRKAAEMSLALKDDLLGDVRKRLENLPGDAALLPSLNRRKTLLICDMDSTIIEQECLDELADFAGLKDEISAITERAMAGELDFEAALTERVAMLKGLSVSAIDECYRTRIRLSEGARTLVATMTKNGARCLLVSGGFTAFTSRVAKAAGFHEHHANILLDDGTVMTGKVGMPILGREAKLTTLVDAASEAGLSASDALAMGDGANDLAMIDAAGLGIAYRAKPVVSAAADAAIDRGDLTTALFFQGYSEEEFVSP
ncbi:MAG: phosphoserine phosphatase SerB [Pseudomonadota bacterium]